MGKIRGDPKQMALAHPTRNAIYSALLSVEEMATVELEKKVNVTRYHLYHHLKQLVNAGLIENHRDKGRARYWKVLARIEASEPQPPAPISKKTEEIPPEATTPDWADNLPPEFLDMLTSGSDFRFIKVGDTAVDAVNARGLMLDLAKMYGVEIDIPFTFTPGGIFVISRPRK